MVNTHVRDYKYYSDPSDPGEKCARLIIDRLLMAREGREKKHIEIYFSLNDILGLAGETHFLQEYAAREMHDCQLEHRLFRNTQQLLACTEYDDSIEDFLQHMGVMENYIYVGEDDILKLKKADLKKNTISDIDLSRAKMPSIFTQVLPPYIFITSSNLLLRVGWWGVHLPDNFMYRLLKNNLISRDGFTKVSDNVYVNIKEGILIGEKRDRIVKKMKGKRKTRLFAIIENLILYLSSGSKYATDFLIKCEKDEIDEIIKMFGEISEDYVVAKRGGMLQFL